MSIEAMKQALEALEESHPEAYRQVITALRTAIEQAQPAPVQEPVAKVYRHGKSSNGTPWHGVHWFDEGVNMPDGTLLYTTPPAQPALVQEPVKLVAYNCKCGRTMKFESVNGVVAAQRQWVGLTDEEMKDVCAQTWSYDPYVIARAIEAKLKEKNT